MMTETLSIDFEYKVITELPANTSEVVYIPNEEPGVGRDGIMVKFFLSEGVSWVGIFAFGDMFPSGECRIYPGPGKQHLTVVAKGDAYIVSPYSVSSFQVVKSCPVIRVIPVPSHNVVIFHDFTEIIAYGENGLLWETKRISWDGIEISEVTSDEIIGQSRDAANEKYVEFRVDLTNGSHKGGASPPEYPT
ncbi:conserved hypothetical protein [Bathymodiolus platifrons methanotrophic gill symbiont]|uniref:hypothetical protein n=2 Tax=Bathymodiolus platifrons methanotrophic gill symbiont TaxID=113268 RepID=UPI000B7019B8|nr:hypothetical protein [Bathymodiolus platifrons methanotrophic gill symbiont]GAW86335.1 conserved hypothetical protein [Bathymodiolus platifrons methanotrophic gill symbiont]GFO77565.1 hypothetical protein BPLS_P6078 [Bathymodiolus platifrons methanotrophic gill symbiont]